MTIAMAPAARSLVRRYYVYAGVYTLAASVIWGINTLFLLDAGLSITGVFVANAAFSVGTVLFEIPTGVTADTVGRRASFLLSLAVLGASTLLYVGLAELSAGVVAFAGASVLMGLGFTFYSGAMEAWLVDGLRGLGYEGSVDGVFATGQIVGGSAMLVGTVGGGVLGQIDLALPFLVRSGLLIVLFVLAFAGMHDIGFEPRHVGIRALPREMVASARLGVRAGWRRRSMRLLILGGAVQGGFFFWAWYAWQPYFLELLADDAVWVAGVVAALLAIAMMVGNGIVKYVTRWCGRRTTLLLWTAGVMTAASVAIGLAGTFVAALAALLVLAVAMGVQNPVRQGFIHEMTGSRERATVVSFDSMIGGIASVGGQAGLGVYADQTSYSAGYVVGGAVTVLALPIVWAVRRGEDPDDYFVGTQAAEPTGCTPQGIPAIASVEAKQPAGV
ncbi:MAG: MFS transporter [Acidimicrobiia bacterium]|nr:MFS transporter [Acidimicrobiia bacterium]